MYRRYFVIGLLFLVVIVNYTDRVALSVGAKPIAIEYNLSPVYMGYLFSSLLWTYALFLIPIGMIVGSIGSKRIIAGGLLVWSLATALTGLSWNFSSILTGRLIMGAGEATTYPAGAKAIRDWTPEKERALVTTLFNSGSVAGPAIGSILVGGLLAALGWRTSFVLLGLVGCILVLPWYLCFGAPEQVSWLKREERETILQERNGYNIGADASGLPPSSIRSLLSRPTVVGMMISQACIVYSIYLFLTWLPSYLQTVLKLDVAQTGLFTAIPYAGTVVIGLAIAWCSDRLLSSTAIRSGRRRFFVAGLMLIGTSVVLAPSVSNAPMLLVLMTIVLTAANTASAMNQTLVNDLSDNPADAPRLMSLLLFGGNIWGLLAPIVTGYVVGMTGGYDWAFRIAAGLLVIGAIVAATLSKGRVGMPLRVVDAGPAAFAKPN